MWTVYEVYWICGFRDHVGATPKERLSEEEGNYQDIVNLLDSKSEPVLQDDIIKVSVRFQVCSVVFQLAIIYDNNSSISQVTKSHKSMHIVFIAIHMYV